MAEKSTKKTVAISIKRARPTIPKMVIMSGFKLRFDKVTGLLDVYLQASGQKGERVRLDIGVIALNLEAFKRFAAGLATDQDDSAEKEEIAVAEEAHFCNIMHCSNLGPRGETIFGLFSVADWVSATRMEGAKTAEVTSFDSVVAISSIAAQKKLLLEIILLISQLPKP